MPDDQQSPRIKTGSAAETGAAHADAAVVSKDEASTFGSNDLNTQRRKQNHVAVMALVVFLCLVFVLIGNDIGQPWIPTLAVILYSILIVTLGERRWLTVTAEVANSPYYLGFLSNLVSIFFAFRQYAVEPGLSKAPILIRTVGSAILTTVAGMTCRYGIQLLCATDSDETAYTKLSAGVKRNVDVFLKGQGDLITAISEFTRHRNQLLKDDQTKSSEYLRALSMLVAEIKIIHSDHLRILRSFGDEVGKLNTFLSETTLALRTSSPALPFKEITDVARKVGTDLSEIHIALSDALNTLASFRSQAHMTEKDLKSIDNILSDFTEILNNRVNALDRNNSHNRDTRA